MRRVKTITGKDAWFHCFSIQYEELKDGVGNYPVAITELDSGQVVVEYAEDITFLTPPWIRK